MRLSDSGFPAVYFSQDILESAYPLSEKADISRQPTNSTNAWDITSDSDKARTTTGGIGSSGATS